MALPNLTREQAIERAALISVDSYQINLDVTDGHGAPANRPSDPPPPWCSTRSPAPTR
ncbi:aminopeptidase N domain protein [Mycobacterium kansasii]|uniref:Aminopeptidase N domain protein n=1 Tax=Mycobacterium kansasii TaxID=1768 RepID=A0A1V3XIW4_MYCKA|nr:aminopeptidase N domain protein [Mycobacterium kansasii]